MTVRKPLVLVGNSYQELPSTDALLDQGPRTPVPDTAYTILTTDRLVAVTALTAARVLTLPASSAYPVGAILWVMDESGACSATLTLTLAVNGTDTINGAASAVIANANDFLALESNGSGKWTIVAQGTPVRAAIKSGTIDGAKIGATTPAAGSFTSLNGGPLDGFHNRIINGNFAINQRAVSGSVTLAAGAYGHDRWKAGVGGCTYTFATSGADTVLTITAGTLLQVVEGANVESTQYRLSWQGTATARMYQSTASGSYAASSIGLSGVTAGSTLTAEFSTGTLSLVQMEFGSVATPFARRPIGMETLLCQRYYTVNGYLYGFAASATAITVLWYMPTQMRVAPTLSVLTTAVQGESPPLTTSYTGASSSITGSHGNVRSFDLQVGGFSGLTAGQFASIIPGMLAASAEL